MKKRKQLRRLQSALLFIFLVLAALISVFGPKDGYTMPTQTDGLYVHFVDVGQADCALLLCGGEAMLIDGGNADDSNLVYTYLQKQGVDHLKYIVNTHAHEDHVGGLSGALNTATVECALCPVTDYDSKAFRNFVRYLAEQGKEIDVPSPGDILELGEARITVLGPLEDHEDTNNTSIVLRVVYGQTSFLFTGDAERAAEADLLQAGRPLQSTVLKLGHHGSNSSSGKDFLSAVAPQYAVISLGKDNSYGHPHKEVLDRLDEAGIEYYRTDLLGDIIAYSDGQSVSFSFKKNSQQSFTPQVSYVLNTNSYKFHDPACDGLKDISSQNKQNFSGSRDEALARGYTACGICRP